MLALGMATAPQIRALTEQVWMGDDDARHILADAYDEIGRRDIAMLWRDELPGYRRRKRVEKLSHTEIDTIRANADQLETGVLFRTGPSDEALALAAIGCMYRAAVSHRGEDERYLAYPRVTWLPSPAIVYRNLFNDEGYRRQNLGEIIWRFRRTWDRQMSVSVLHEIIDAAHFGEGLSLAVRRAGEDEDLPLRTGLASGQFDHTLLRHAAVIDVLRLVQGLNEDLYPEICELSLRASLALMQCTPMYYPFEKACVLSTHPTVIDGDQPRWAWLDGENHPHQWPTTR